MIEFEELRSGKSLAYYMYKTLKNGSKHTVNKNLIENTFFTVYDYDLKIQFLVLFGALGFGFKQIIGI